MKLVSVESFFNSNLYKNSMSKANSIVPLFIEKGNKLRLLGSAVYLTIDGSFFIATASHILDTSRALITAASENEVAAIPAKGYYFYREWADVAIAELKRELPPLFEPVLKSEIRDYNILPKGMPLVALGFPGSKAKVYSSTADCTLLSVVSYEEGEREYNAANSKKPNQIAIHFKRKKMKSANGTKIEAPIVNGMSGGGLFWIHNEGKIASSKPMLVGILTHWNAPEQSTLVATHIGFIERLLKDGWKVAGG